ncbi:hypothetical protein GCM10011273_27520 [Asticcacaulis endophyticus]|uniref:Uncharacterized protein n=1 Tax=Asticcacaulis endophyticus TaxID=1395890 RepID=A0A918QA49_9CAUL|nr:hypothetical protein GCM10011273_27520 [Asticcacaulis endophyticus]
MHTDRHDLTSIILRSVIQYLNPNMPVFSAQGIGATHSLINYGKQKVNINQRLYPHASQRTVKNTR